MGVVWFGLPVCLFVFVIKNISNPPPPTHPYLTPLQTRPSRDRCQARWHFGKASWMDVQVEQGRCFDGATAYPQSWCHFGCAAAELDPTGKFAGAGQGARNIWSFNAKKGGEAVPLASCCTPQGFSAECECAKRPACS